MRVLVTGADGFVGGRLVPALVDSGHDIVAAVVPTGTAEQHARRKRMPDNVEQMSLNLLDTRSVDSAVQTGWDAVIHLAAVASGAQARRDPVSAWDVNALGTVRLCDALGRLSSEGVDPLMIYVSTAEVYGAGPPVPRLETDDLRPCSSYAASKLAAETAVLEAHRRFGLRVLIARPFPHTGAGQDGRFVIPAFVKRVLEAKRDRKPAIKVGNLDPVRDFLHVDDVVDAYASLLDSGSSGEAYNVSSGTGYSIGDLLAMVAEAADYHVKSEVDADLMRPADIPHLVGDSGKLRAVSGWQPRRTLKQAIREVVDAQTE